MPQINTARWWTYLAAIIIGLAILAPFAWMLSTALMSTSQTLQIPPKLLPSPFTFEGVKQVFARLPFASLLGNTVFVSAARVVGTLIVATLAAYALAVIKVPGTRIIIIFILALLMVPGDIFIIPNYAIISKLHLTNTLTALFLPNLFDVFAVFLIYQFFRAIPGELVEAARMDGASHLRILATIVIPVSRSGVITVALLTVLSEWKELLWPIVINSSVNKLPLGPGLALLQGTYTTQYNVLMAGGVLAALPMVIIFLLLQRHFIASVARSGLK